MSNQDGKTHISAIMEAMEAAGYKLALQPFTFESSPESIVDNSYRVEVRKGPSEDETGRVRKYPMAHVFSAHLLPAGDDAGARKVTFLDIVDKQDLIEDLIIKATANFKIWHESSDMIEEFAGLFIIQEFIFRIEYWRNIYD